MSFSVWQSSIPWMLFDMVDAEIFMHFDDKTQFFLCHSPKTFVQQKKKKNIEAFSVCSLSIETDFNFRFLLEFCIFYKIYLLLRLTFNQLLIRLISILFFFSSSNPSSSLTFDFFFKLSFSLSLESINCAKLIVFRR